MTAKVELVGMDKLQEQLERMESAMFELRGAFADLQKVSKEIRLEFDDVVRALVEKIKFLSERATTAAEVEALAAVVQALAKFLSCSYRGEEVRWDGRASGDQRKAGSH